MKKLLIINMIAGLFLLSCDNEVKDNFDDSAAVRVQKSMDECFDLLTSATNGWVIQYYANLSLGGYNYIAKFGDDGFVTVAFELANDITETRESHFSINASAGAVLTFDTYNEFIHFFSDPDPGAGSTYGGDFEFTYVKGNKSEMEFKGTKSGNTIILKALPEDQDWEEYLVSGIELEDYFVDEYFAKFTYEGSEPFAFVGTTNRAFTYADPSDKEGVAQLLMPYIFTIDGIKLYEPIVIGGKEVQNFVWDDENNQLVSTDPNASDIILKAGFSDTFVPYDFYLGEWTFTFDKFRGNQDLTETITLVENVRNKSYIFKSSDAFQDYDIVVEWSAIDGNLSMVQQRVGSYLIYQLYLEPWMGDESTGNFNYWPGYNYIGMDIIYSDRDAEKPVLNFENNGYVAAEGMFIGRYTVYPTTFSGNHGSLIRTKTLSR